MAALIETLRSRDPRLANEAESLIRRAVPLLWHSYATFPDGTSHTPEHTNSVEQIASAMIPDTLRSELSTSEIYFLLLACHFHDLGMVGTASENRTEASKNQVRRDHAISIGVRLVQDWQDLGFPDLLTAEALKEVCRGHRPHRDEAGRAHWSDLDTEFVIGPDNFIRTRLVAALIYAADELHIEAGRARERERRWLEIEGESRCHWRRHQAIAGPTLIQEAMLFEATVETPAFEANLRREVLQKAFSAVRDTNDELMRQGVAGRLRTPTLKWKRDRLWELLIVKVCSDMTPRSEPETRDAVFDRFKEERDKFVVLSSYCDERPSDEEIRSRIERTVGDMKIRSILTASKGAETLELAPDGKTSAFFLKTVRDADELDNLFLGEMRVTHELELFNTSFGARYIETTTFPHVNEVFGIKLTTEPKDSEVMVALRSSPSASAMISALRNSGSNRVDRRAFETVVLAGAIYDIAQHPHLMLQERFRHKLNALATQVNKGSKLAMRWAEELALTTGYALDQFSDLLCISNEMIQSAEPAATKSRSVHFSQSLSISNPQLNIGPLLLASRRLGEQVEIRSLPESQLTFRVEEDAPKPVDSIAIGPGDRSVGKVAFVMRGVLELDEQTRVATFACHGLGSFPDPTPFTIHFTTTPATTTCTFEIAPFPPEATLATERQIELLNRLSNTGSIEIRIDIDGRRFISHVCQANQPPHISRYLDDAAWSKLKVLPDDIPVPPALKRKWDADLLEIRSDPNKIGEVITRWRSEPIQRTSVTLRIATATKVDFKEAFLGYLPVDREFSKPTVLPDSPVSQNEINAQFERGELVTGGLFSEDFEQLAKMLEVWAENMEGPFPISTSQDGVPHVLKTEVSIFHLPQRNRVTYLERPVLIRLRPLTELEQRKTEFEYWKFRGDESRAQLVLEIIRRMESCLLIDGAGI